MSWNSDYGGRFGVHSPAGMSAFPLPNGRQGYNPSYIMPPPGPPPSSLLTSRSVVGEYPGQHHQNYFAPPSEPPPGGYGPPSGPPNQYGASSPFMLPPGSPPMARSSAWGPPPGPTSGYGTWPENANPYSPGPYAMPPGPPPPPPEQTQRYGPQFETNGHTEQPFFQYSQCNGRRKALCIGINYFGQTGELRGCINDVNNVKRFLTASYGYKDGDIVALTDDAQDPRQIPTSENIIAAMHWLVRDAQPNDSLFFHYSGHGGQTKDLDGDEAGEPILRTVLYQLMPMLFAFSDGFDEVIYPVDYEANGHIVDDDMHAIMVRPLPPGCRLTAIFDSCHSGTALDLPYIYSTEGQLKEPNLAAEAGSGLLSAVTSYARGDTGGALRSAFSVIKGVAGHGDQQKADEYAKQTRTSPADAIQFSGCKDSQTSADTVEAGQATGAMSYAFILALTQNPQQSYQQLLNSLRSILKDKYSQKPQLSSSHPIDTNLLFVM